MHTAESLRLGARRDGLRGLRGRIFRHALHACSTPAAAVAMGSNRPGRRPSAARRVVYSVTATAKISRIAQLGAVGGAGFRWWTA